MSRKKEKRESWREKQRRRLLKQQRAQEAYRIQREKQAEKKPRKWPKGKILGAFCFIILIFGIYGYWQYYNSQLPPSIGGSSAAGTSPPQDLAPTFSIKDINGTHFSLSQHKGKVVIIHFMAVGCSGQIYTINVNQLKQLRKLCNSYCRDKPFVMVTVAVATCPNSQLSNIRSSYGVTWILGNDYDDQTLDIVDAYMAYSIKDGSVLFIDKKFHVAKVYTEEITAETVMSEINQLLEA
jgi:peroxiredoxin